MDISWLQTNLTTLLIICFALLVLLAIGLLITWTCRNTEKEKAQVILQVEEPSIVDLYNYKVPGKSMVATRPPKNPSRESDIANLDSVSTIAENGHLELQIADRKQSNTSSSALLFRI
jgi:hypothetical protein